MQAEEIEADEPEGKNNKKPRNKYIPGLICVDTFSKLTTVVLLPGAKKDTAGVAAGLMEAFVKMGYYLAGQKPRLPKTIYSDSESALTSKEIQEWFKEKDIRHVTTQGHAPVAERTIRTIKALYEEKHNKANKNWKVILQDSVNAYNDHIHSATRKQRSRRTKTRSRSI